MSHSRRDKQQARKKIGQAALDKKTARQVTKPKCVICGTTPRVLNQSNQCKRCAERLSG